MVFKISSKALAVANAMINGERDTSLKISVSILLSVFCTSSNFQINFPSTLSIILELLKISGSLFPLC